MKLRIFDRTVGNKVNIGNIIEADQVGLSDAVEQVRQMYDEKLKAIGGYQNAGQVYSKIALVDPDVLTPIRTVFVKKGPRKLY